MFRHKLCSRLPGSRASIKDELRPVLVRLPKLSHVLITVKLEGSPRPPLPTEIDDAFMNRVAALANSSRTICWLGFHVQGRPMRGWTVIHRADEKGAPSAVFVEMSGKAVMDVVEAEGMSVFGDEKIKLPDCSESL